MKLSFQWLNELVDCTGLAPTEVADKLTNAGLEVEAVETLGPKFSKVIVAKVLALDPHPNADKLRLVTVDQGPVFGTTQVVCGAPNVAVGQLIAFAQDGATVISRKEGSVFTLGKAVIRGVESCGMVCAIQELGLEDRYPVNPEGGIWTIEAYANETQLGEDLAKVLGLSQDALLHTAPTANRGDWMSVWGVARDVAACFNRPLTAPINLEKAQATLKQAKTTGLKNYSVALSDPSVCPYYAGALLTNVKIQLSPDWVKAKLEAAGVRSINNVVDITNLVMLAIGQPLHAFDANKLTQQYATPDGKTTIGVRRANAGETLVTLDELTQTLTEESVLITGNDKPIALAGLMGGHSTAINDETTSVFLEAAAFPSATTRRSSRSVGFRTEASARFERGVDPETTPLGLYYAIELMQQLAGGTLEGMTVSGSAKPFNPQEKPLTLRFDRLTKMLGMSIPVDQIKATLAPLGFTIVAEATDSLTVSVPSFRQTDVTEEIDLIEEVIRIYGYEHIPYTLPSPNYPASVTHRETLLAYCRNALISLGLTECATSSLLGPELLTQMEMAGTLENNQTLVKLSNSHSEEHTLMRQSLLPTLLDVGMLNQAQGNDCFWGFELGRAYFNNAKPNVKHSGVQEKLMLSGLLYGHPLTQHWHAGNPNLDFYSLKGLLETLFKPLQNQIAFEAVNGSNAADATKALFHPGRTAVVMMGPAGKQKPLGILGQLHPGLQSRLKFRQPVFLFELEGDTLLKQLAQALITQPFETLPIYPAVKRDIALLAEDGVSHAAIETTMKNTKHPLLQGVQLFDEYHGDPLPPGKRNLAYRLTLQSQEGTLTDKQIEEAVQQIKTALKTQHPITLRE